MGFQRGRLLWRGRGAGPSRVQGRALQTKVKDKPKIEKGAKPFKKLTMKIGDFRVDVTQKAIDNTNAPLSIRIKVRFLLQTADFVI